MKTKNTFAALAFVAYMAAAGLTLANSGSDFWTVAIVCAIMCIVPHPPLGHFLCSVFLLGESMGWIGLDIASIVIVFCLVCSTKMLEKSKKPQPVPKWESNGYQDRLNEGMVFVGDGDD